MGRNTENRRRRRARLQALVKQLKDVPCADCGARYESSVMEMDHFRGDKAASISRLVNTAREKALYVELSKCQAVCANCHRLRTKARMVG